MSACPDPSVLDAIALGAAAADTSERAWKHAETCSLCGPFLSELLRLYGSDRSLQSSGSTDNAADWALASTIASEPPARRASLDDGVGERLVGRYRLIEKLGEGAMGEVFAAHDPELDRRVAVKVLRADPLVEPEARKQRLVREAQAMAKLAHPNVVTVFDVGVDAASGQLFVAMELVDGTTLGAWVKSAKRSEGELLSAFIQAGKGLAAAHVAGLVHRDFKPDNILVGRDGRVRVSDFGLARASIGESAARGLASEASPELTQAGAIVGTPAYMAPEQPRGESVDARTDQFAFGVALYEAFYGTRPFDGKTFGELRDNVLSGRHRSFDRLKPRWIRDVLTRALSTDPASRFASMDAIVSELDRDPSRSGAALSGLPARSRSSPSSSQCPSFSLPVATM